MSFLFFPLLLTIRLYENNKKVLKWNVIRPAYPRQTPLLFYFGGWEFLLLHFHVSNGIIAAIHVTYPIIQSNQLDIVMSGC